MGRRFLPLRRPRTRRPPARIAGNSRPPLRDALRRSRAGIHRRASRRGDRLACRAARPSAVALVKCAASATRARLDRRRTGEGGLPVALGVCGKIHGHRRPATHELSDPLENAFGRSTAAGIFRHAGAGSGSGGIRIRVLVFTSVRARNRSHAWRLAQERRGMNATVSFNGKGSHNDHVMPGTLSKNVSKGAGSRSGGVVLDSSAKSSIFNAETTFEGTDSDSRLNYFALLL